MLGGLERQWKKNMGNELPTQKEWDKLYSPNGGYAIRKMFYELSTPAMRKKYPPIFTLKPYPYKGLPSVYQTYMNSIDEYDAATKIVPNMKEWDKLKAAHWFFSHDESHSFEGLKSWREHMKQRDASTARAALFEKIEKGDVTAAKAILADTKTKAPVGRKNKKTTEEKASIARITDYRNKG